MHNKSTLISNFKKLCPDHIHFAQMHMTKNITNVANILKEHARNEYIENKFTDLEIVHEFLQVHFLAIIFLPFDSKTVP